MSCRAYKLLKAGIFRVPGGTRMATSPDFLRLASNATHPLAETALDCLRDAVLVIDVQHRQLPLILANAAARHCLRGEIDAADLIDWPLARLLDEASAAKIKTMLAAASAGCPSSD